MLRWMRTTALALLRHEQAADAFEYLLVVGAVVVAMVIAIQSGFTSMLPQVLEPICAVVDPAAPTPPSPGSCFLP